MRDPGGGRSAAVRALTVLARALPSHRREWGQAMLAEVAGIDDLRARRRFAWGCARAVLSDGSARRDIAERVIALTLIAAALAFAISIRFAGVRSEAIAMVVGLALLAWSGTRGGSLGPVADVRLARRIRGGGYVAVGALTIGVLSGADKNDPGGWWIAALCVAAYLAFTLLLTARHTAAPVRALGLSAALTVAGLAAWWIPMLAFTGVRANPGWALLSVAVVALLALVIATALRWPAPHVGLATLAAGAATCLLIFLAATGTYSLLPRLAPDLGHVAGMTAGGQAEQNQIEATDPYVAEFILGALLSLLVTAAGIATRRGQRRLAGYSATYPKRGGHVYDDDAAAKLDQDDQSPEPGAARVIPGAIPAPEPGSGVG
jgi:hypothetical protein